MLLYNIIISPMSALELDLVKIVIAKHLSSQCHRRHAAGTR